MEGDPSRYGLGSLVIAKKGGEKEGGERGEGSRIRTGTRFHLLTPSARLISQRKKEGGKVEGGRGGRKNSPTMRQANGDGSSSPYGGISLPLLPTRRGRGGKGEGGEWEESVKTAARRDGSLRSSALYYNASPLLGKEKGGRKKKRYAVFHPGRFHLPTAERGKTEISRYPVRTRHG